MNYRYCGDRDFSDYAAGRVLKGGAGMPNFPARLALELYARGAERLNPDQEIRLWDPLCGSGCLLTVVALLADRAPRLVCGSDLNPDAVRLAQENLALLTPQGCARRRAQLQQHLQDYGRPSYAEALESLERIERAREGRQVETCVCVHDALLDAPPPLPARPNLVLTDLPYGVLVPWRGQRADLGERLLQCLRPHLAPGAIAVVCMDKRQSLCSEGCTRLEKQQLGKRRFEIYQMEA